MLLIDQVRYKKFLFKYIFMCGIVALLLKHINNPHHDNASRLTVEKVCQQMALRGPDAQGVWQGGDMTMGHRRLSILDLDVRSNQPMLSQDGRYVIVFNGEIYNFRELRKELELAGVMFHTTSDTEVLLELFAAEGDAMLPRLRGMFAFAIWDTLHSELFLARDPYGIKPLYYGKTIDGGFIIASQVKALLASELVLREQEPAGLAGFYLWGSVPEPWTLYRRIFALPAGHWMRIIDGETDLPVCWNDIRQYWRGVGAHITGVALQEKVRNAVIESVQAHLVADVPVCVFLSGGIDSSVIAGIASDLGVKVEGITIGFDEFSNKQDDEVPIAAVSAAHFGLTYFVRQVSRAEFEQDIPRIIDAMDQPSIDGVNTWFASKGAAERGYKVVLSGVGGDELFMGYSSFKRIPYLVSFISAISSIPNVSSMLKPIFEWLGKRILKEKLAGFPAFMSSIEGLYFLQRCLFLPEELSDLMGEEKAREGLERLGGIPPGMTRADARDGFSAIGLLESTLYMRNQLLRDSDWASMAHSLELRTPFVDERMLELLGPYLSGFVGSFGKLMLSRSPMKLLPVSVTKRKKTGFSTPISTWLSQATDQLQLDINGNNWGRCWAKFIIKKFE